MQKVTWIMCCVLFMGCAAGHKLGWHSPYKELSSLEEGDIVHIPTGVEITLEQLIELLTGARVVYVGEAHDNVNSHKVQLKILKALAEQRPGEIAVGMEMLKRSSQWAADQWTSGNLSEKEFVKTWLEDWGNDFEYYRPILQYVQEHRIPLLALRAPDDWLEAVRGADSAAQLEDSRETLPEMDVEDVFHRAHTEAVFEKHPKHMKSFEDFYRVQVLWDESMAASVSEYLVSKEGRDKQILIFAGQQHVEYGFGIPRRVFRRIPSPYAVVLTTVAEVPPEKRHKFMKVTLPEVPLLAGHFAWIVRYQDLEDQRVYLGVMIRDTDAGVEIMGVSKDSAGGRAGLEKEDIITSFDGEAVETKSDLRYLIGLKKPGDSGTIEVLRDEKPLSCEVTFQAGASH